MPVQTPVRRSSTTAFWRTFALARQSTSVAMCAALPSVVVSQLRATFQILEIVPEGVKFNLRRDPHSKSGDSGEEVIIEADVIVSVRRRVALCKSSLLTGSNLAGHRFQAPVARFPAQRSLPPGTGRTRLQPAKSVSADREIDPRLAQSSPLIRTSVRAVLYRRLVCSPDQCSLRRRAWDRRCVKPPLGPSN